MKAVLLVAAIVTFAASPLSAHAGGPGRGGPVRICPITAQVADADGACLLWIASGRGLATIPPIANYYRAVILRARFHCPKGFRADHFHTYFRMNLYRKLPAGQAPSTTYVMDFLVTHLTSESEVFKTSKARWITIDVTEQRPEAVAAKCTWTLRVMGLPSYKFSGGH
jgi:hypothetical protein